MCGKQVRQGVLTNSSWMGAAFTLSNTLYKQTGKKTTLCSTLSQQVTLNTIQRGSTIL